MDSIKLWARDGEAVRQAIEFGEIAHMETAREELTDAFLLFAIESGLLQTWAQTFPDPRREPTIGMEVILPAHIAARFAGLYSMRKAGYVLRSARVRREQYVGVWLPEPLVDEAGDWSPSPEAQAEFAQDVSVAFLLTLERLSPLERAAFLLHEVFELDFDEIDAAD